MHRRTVLKWVSALPVFGAIAVDGLWDKSQGRDNREYLLAHWRPILHQRAWHLDVS
jgi:hypothetical protein